MKDVKKASIEREDAIKENARKHRKRRKRNLSLYYFLMAIATISVIITLSLTVFFKITDITVDGKTEYFPEDIITVTGMKVGNNLILSDTKSAQTRIINAFLMIDSVEIKKVFPSKVLIKVSPAVPLFQVCDSAGRYITVSSNNKVISVKTEASEDVMFISGVSASEVKEGDFIGDALEGKETVIENIVNEFSKYEITDIRGIDIISSADIRVNVEDRINIKLGSEAKLAYKTQLVSKVIKEEIGTKEHGTIDATIAGKVAFRPE